MIKTDFCIAGFPKCGTSALARYIDALDSLHLARDHGNLEAPFFRSGDGVPTGAYIEGKKNGHKFSAYILGRTDLLKLYAHNNDVLFIFCVRSALESLLSWHNMHRKAATSGRPATHFVNQDATTRAFYASCSVEEYYRTYAKQRLDYEARIKWFRKHLPDARFLIVSQARLSSDPISVMKRITKLLDAPSNERAIGALLPKEVRSFGSTGSHKLGVPEWIHDELGAADRSFKAYMVAQIDRGARLLMPGSGESEF